MDSILTPAMEDYLELILKLQEANRVVRVRDIAQGMSVKMPSVTSMLNTLARNDLINHGKYEYVELTPRGLSVAQEASHKHTALFSFLKDILKVDPQQADSEACRMEHAITGPTLSKLLDFLEFCRTCPSAAIGWLDYFKRHCRNGTSPEECREHMKDALKNASRVQKQIAGGKEKTGPSASSSAKRNRPPTKARRVAG
jgi:DtxR family transcriptional regulator, Mn-dependent transcriptional regulator